MSEAATLDRRIHAYRPDLADRRLEGRVAAERFVDGSPMRVTAPSTPIRRAPHPGAPIDTEALMGEAVTVFEETIEGWAWIQLRTDGYVGYVSSDALGPESPAPTHAVTALRTFVYPGPDMKLPPIGALSIGASVAIAGETETRGTPFGQLAGGGGAVVLRHVAPLDSAPAPDFVAVAERFLNLPYLWGGRTSLGIDCSGLVQLALAAAGHAVPRDTDQQAAVIGGSVGAEALDAPRRGDLVFWKGHVGIIRDTDTLLHASGYQMEVVAEPLRAALARIKASAGPPVAVRRIF